MSVSKWAYSPEKCDGDYCPGDCDNCGKAEEEETGKYVRREAVKVFFTWWVRKHQELGNYKEEFMADVDRIKSADVEPMKTGRWNKYGTNESNQVPCCSLCGVAQYWRTKYCPACGAKMEDGR